MAVQGVVFLLRHDTVCVRDLTVVSVSWSWIILNIHPGVLT